MSQPWMSRVNNGIALFRARWMVDLEGLASRLQSYIVSRMTVEPMEIDLELAFNRSWRTLGMASVSTSGMWSDRFRKIVISQQTFGPISSGLVVVLMPQRGIDLPCFHASLTTTPTELTADIDLYSPFFGERAYGERCARFLSEVQQSHRQLERQAPPEWAAELASKQGLSIRVPCQMIEEVAAALFDFLDQYLDLILDDPYTGAARSAEQEARSDEVIFAFSRAFQPHPPSGERLERLFGRAWAERYSSYVYSA